MTALVPAATVLLVRDAPALEVLMVERAYQIDFASGALVFPGGKLAAEDADPAWEACAAGLNLTAQERAFRVAAVREAFEESGVLLARRAGLSPGAALAGQEETESLLPHRAAVAAGEASFLGLIREAGLSLALESLIPFAHWITPNGMPRRFDTRFYIAETPAAQDAAHDGHESVEAVWLAPEAALQAAAEGRRKVIFPTKLNLELLAQSRAAGEAVAAAKARAIVTVEPVIAADAEGVLRLSIPETAGYGAVSARLDEVT